MEYKEWSYGEVKKMLDGVCDRFDYGKHEPLINLTAVFDSGVSPMDDTEVTFAVPIKFLWLFVQTHTGWQTLSEKAKNGWKDYDLERIKEWFESTYYNSDTSREILLKAIEENKVAFCRIS